MTTFENEIKLSEDAVNSIVEIVILESKSVSLPNNLGYKALIKNNPIISTIENGLVSISVNLFVDYGTIIHNIAPSIQNSIKENVEIMTNLTVSNIDLFICGINK